MSDFSMTNIRCPLRIVFSSCFLARRRCHRRQPQPSLVAHASWRSPNGHPSPRRCRPEGEDCQCPSQQHALGRGWRLQQHHAEYVVSTPLHPVIASCVSSMNDFGEASAGIALPVEHTPRASAKDQDAFRCIRTDIGDGSMLTPVTGLYTDESPGLKVDPVVVLVLSLVFIFSVVALHSTSCCAGVSMSGRKANMEMQLLPKLPENSRAKCRAEMHRKE